MLLVSKFWHSAVCSGCANHWGKMSAPNIHGLNASERWWTAGGCNPHVTEADPGTLSDCICQRWWWESAAASGTGLLTGLLSLKLLVFERTSFSLVIFPEHALLFNGWWNIIKEYIHYWCLSKKFLLASASFPPYNASFTDPFASHWGSPIHASFAIWTICFTQNRDNRQCSLNTEGIQFLIFVHIC